MHGEPAQPSRRQPEKPSREPLHEPKQPLRFDDEPHPSFRIPRS